MDIESQNRQHVDKLRDKQRLELQGRRKQQRNAEFGLKRSRLLDVQTQLTGLTVDEVVSLAKKMRRAKRDVESLRKLSASFASGINFIELFLKVDGALQGLVGALTCREANIQTEAASCLINLATGPHMATHKVAKVAGPYLVTYLHSGSPTLQELCSWALGNVASDCNQCCTLLTAQGIIPAVVPLMQSTNESVVWSACFLLAGYTRTATTEMCLQTFNQEVLHSLSEILVRAENSALISDAANVVFNLTARSEFDDVIMATGLVGVLLRLLASSVESDMDEVKVLTPVVRALGNLSSSDSPELLHCIYSHQELGTLVVYLLNCRARHVVKETIWLLANLTGNAEGCCILQHGSILPRLVDLLNNMGEISSQALVCLWNIANVDKCWCDSLIKLDILTNLKRIIMLMPDLETLRLALALLLLLRNTASIETQELSSIVVSDLDCLQFHGNPEVQKIMVEFLSHVTGLLN